MSRARVCILIIIVAIAAAAVVLRRQSDRGESDGRPSRRAVVAPERLRIAADTGASTGYSWLVEPGADERRVAGRVMREGTPLAEASVRLVSARTRDGDQQSPAVTTDDDGFFDFGEQSPMTLLLVASAPGLEPSMRVLALDDSSKEFDDLIVELQACRHTIRGRIVDIDGTPISGARLSEQRPVAVAQGGLVPAHAAYVDDDGEFSLCTSGDERTSLMASAPGYGTVPIDPSRVGEYLTIRLNAESAMSGSVVDDEGSPIAGAMVVLTRPMSSSISTELPAMQSAMSDEDGRFFIDGIAAGAYVLGADHLRFYTPYDDRGNVVLRPGETLSRTIVMKGLFQLAGTVIAGDRPIPGERVQIDDCKMKLTQPDGSFVTWCAESADERTVRVSGHDVVEPKSRRLTRAEVDLVIEVRRGATVTGRVVSSGTPVEGALIAQDERQLRREGPAYINTRSDGSGRFELYGIEPGRHALAVLQPATGHRTVAEPVSVSYGDTIDVGDIDLNWRGRVYGKVTDREHKGIAGCTVVVRSEETTRRARTTDDGSFDVRGLPAAEYEIEVRGRDGALMSLPQGPARVDVGGDGASDPIDLVVETGSGRIAGQVVYDGGAAAAGARLRLVSGGGKTAWVTAGVDGAFEFQRLSGARYDIEARGEAGASGRLSGVAPGDEDVEVLLPRAGGIHGTLVGAADGTVRAHLSVEGVGALPRLDEHVGQARGGEFALRGLVPGHYRVTAVAGDAIARADAVVRSGEVAEVRLRMRTVAVLRGRLVDDTTGSPITGAGCTGGSSRSSRTDSDGRFVMESVPEAEPFIVRCEATDGARLAGSAAVQSIGDGASIEVRAVRRGARLGVRFEIADRGIDVATVEPWAATADGLSAGDRLVAVDGVRVADRLLDCVAHLHLRPPNTDVALVVDRDGVERSLTLRTAAD